MNIITERHKGPYTRWLHSFILPLLLMMMGAGAWATDITSLPFKTDFSTSIDPFAKTAGDGVVSYNQTATNVGHVLSVYNATATAAFTGGYTLKGTEQVAVSFTAYHGWFNQDRSSTIAIKNTAGETLVSYTYNKNSTLVTDVTFGSNRADGFSAFPGISKYDASYNANGFVGGANARAYQTTAGYNPTITMTVSANGLVTFHFVCAEQGITRSYNAVIRDRAINLGSIVITDNGDNADRGIGIDDLSITSQLYANDYETGVVDWTTGTGGRYTPIIMTDGVTGNKYMAVAQDQRNNNGTTLTNSAINGSAKAGEDFTLSFDMKIGCSDRNQKPTKFAVFDASNTELFSFYDEGTTEGKWKLKVDNNSASDIDLTGTGTSTATDGTALDALTWYHFKLSYTDKLLYVTITSLDGATTYWRSGYTVSSAGGLSKMTFETTRYNANFAFDNLKVATYANTRYTLSGKSETFTITSEGDLKQRIEGMSVILEYGTTDEGQLTKTNGGNIGAYCVYKGSSDTKTYTTAWTTGKTNTVAPSGGTFYKFTPKFNGYLSITGGVEDAEDGTLNDVVLRKKDGSVSGDSEKTTGYAGMVHAFSMELVAGTDYYLYAATPETGDNDGTKGSKATLFLASFTFTQTSMHREVKVSDLLYANGKTQTDGLDRTIPGFDLTFTGEDKVETVVDGQQLKLKGNTGTMVITLRQSSPTHDAKIHSVVFQVENADSGTKVTVNGVEHNITNGKNTLTLGVDAASATIVCTVGNFRFSSFSVGYNGTNDAETHLWLNDSKTTPSISFSTTHIMRVPGDGQSFTNTPTVSSPSGFSANYTYTSSNTTIATIDDDGTNGQLLRSGSATITASVAETDYFNGTTATYTVDNVLHYNETYTRTVTNNNIVRIDAKAADANTTLTLTGTGDGSLTLGTDVNKNLTTANSTTVTLSNGTSNDITVEAFRNYSKNPVAYLYYEGQENNYNMQLHFQGFASGDVKGFRVLDIGDPIEPIDLTAAYSLKDGANYAWTDGSHVTASNLTTTLNSSTGSFTAGSKSAVDDDHPETLLPTITHLLTKTGTANGYPDELTATANIFIATPPDDDTYKVWDMTTSVTSWGQMDSRWTWDGHGYYQTSLPEFLPILNSSHNTLAGNEGLLVEGDLRYHTGTTGLRMNLTRVNAKLRFPVKKGMEVKIEMASASADVNHVISNVTDLTGASTNSLYIEYQGINSPITAYYLAEADGAIEISSMDRTGAYLKRITLQVPRIHFNEEIVTVPATAAAITNVPYNTGTASLTYSIGGEYNLPATYGADGTSAVTGTVALAINASNGKVSVRGTEGYVIVNVENPSATGVQPKKGSYRLYVIDFKFDPATEALNLTGADNGEVTFTRRPAQADKVVQPVTYTMTASDGARGWLTQETKTNPRETSYELTVYSPGTIRLTATTGRISTSCDVTITGGNIFAEVAPHRSLDELPKDGDNRYFLNELPAGFNLGTTTFVVDIAGEANCGAVTIETIADAELVDHYYAKVPTITGSGALRVTATNTVTNDNGTPEDQTDDYDVVKTAQFVLTIAYPASGGHKWNFHQVKKYDSGSKYGLKIGPIDDYNGDPTQTKTSVTVTGTNSWTTENTSWDKIYRKGDEQPRWAYTHSMRGYNAFVVEETAGLVIETGQKGFYIDNPHQPSEFAYNHIGLHNNASVTIPRLKQGDYIVLNLCRTLPNQGAILSMTNVTDLAGTTVDHAFTITRSQIDYKDSGGNPATVSSGTDADARYIPGVYTFRAAADGDVTLTLEDEGCLDILSIEIYDGSYKPTMKALVLDDGTTPPTSYLKDDDEHHELNFPICNILESTSVGPADYVLMSQKGDINATLENVPWYSPDGVYYNRGRLSVKEGYGKVLVRMNNYTVDGRYLIGYTPTYSLTVGHKPHQEYPYTWDFTNISGGAVLGKSNNVYNSIGSDYQTWTYLGYETYQLDTETAQGSFYVPGATLVTEERELGAKGSIAELNAAHKGCDEFNGLGFNGKIAFKVAQQGSTDPVPPTSLSGSVDGSLLEYSFAYSTESQNTAYLAQGVTDGSKTTWTSAELTAGDGKVMFGSPGKRETPGEGVTMSVTSATYVYKMDGGNTKNVKLIPQRPFQNGDHILLTGYSAANVQNSGFSFYAAANDVAANVLATIHWPYNQAANTEATLDYTVTRGDGIAGRSELYVFRANKQYTVYLSKVEVTGDDSSAPTAYERAITSVSGPVTVTIPDLQLNHYVYIKSDAAPSSLTNLTAAADADGLDATTNVRKYKVTADGNADVTFAAGTKIYRIGVTNIMKPLTRVGSGDAWATESRDHAIDYTQTGHFTVNNITANTVTATKYELKKVTVKMNELTQAVPEETGLVLKLKMNFVEGDKKVDGTAMSAEEASDATTAAPTNFAKAKGGNEVPLFYPPYSQYILNPAAVCFGGTDANLMMANLNERLLTQERETGVIDKNGDNVDDSGDADGAYTRFIFAQRYMKWQKVTGDDKAVPTDEEHFTESGDLPVFYRMHLYDNDEATKLSSTAAALNTLGANKAYMLIRKGNVPDALWKNDASPVKRFIGIEGISDFSEIFEDAETSEHSDHSKFPGTYTLGGQRVNSNGTLPPGIYIRNGRKIVVK